MPFKQFFDFEYQFYIAIPMTRGVPETGSLIYLP